MPRKGPLRAVQPGETPPASRRGRPKALKTAVNGTERDLLIAMRAKLAAEMDAGVPAHALSPLSRRLLDVDKEIRQLDARHREATDLAGHEGDDDWDADAI